MKLRSGLYRVESTYWQLGHCNGLVNGTRYKKVKDLACLRTMFDRTESEIRTPKLEPLNPALPQSLNPTLTHPEPPK